METLKEFDWCLDQLDTLRASMSISEMASNKVSETNCIFKDRHASSSKMSSSKKKARHFSELFKLYELCKDL